MGFFTNLFAGGIGEIVDSVSSGIDKFVTTDAEKKEFELQKQQMKLTLMEIEMKADEMIFNDRQSARRMYDKDNSLQKIFAVVFLVGYLAISALILWMVIGWLDGSQMDNWTAALISSVFTAMSGKVNTIVDFLFGGSDGGNKAEAKVAEALEKK